MVLLVDVTGKKKELKKEVVENGGKRRRWIRERIYGMGEKGLGREGGFW